MERDPATCPDHAWLVLDTAGDAAGDLEEECTRCGDLRTVPLDLRESAHLAASARSRHRRHGDPDRRRSRGITLLTPVQRCWDRVRPH